MLIWNQSETAFYNTDNVFCFSVRNGYAIYANEFCIAEYTSFNEAIKELKELELQIISGMSTYKMP